MFRCFQNGKRCSEYQIKSWDVDTFESFEEANIFCIHWSYPIGTNQIPDFFQQMELGIDKNLSMSESPVLMCIREVS